jgi:hypothetical protein
MKNYFGCTSLAAAAAIYYMSFHVGMKTEAKPALECIFMLRNKPYNLIRVCHFSHITP